MTGIHRYAIFAMDDGPGAGPVCEADTNGGALMAMACLANEGAPGWYVVVDREPPKGPHGRQVQTYFAPEGVTMVSLHASSPQRPWVEAARAAMEAT